ncbi:MAG: NAD(P)-dependent alcohol dehydrogenase [Balneolaceae bacterium]|nr:NAD(P)-dependent alcohol dehydrogenase [Balneolaceae bacterium]
MKAILTTKYGSPDVLQVSEVETPVPKDHEILIKVHASSATKADTMMRKGIPFYGRFFLGLTKPKNPITGTGFAGEIVKVGPKVTRYTNGDQVFGETGVNFGANAEFVCMPEDGLVIPKPSSLSYEEAAPICDGVLSSMNFLSAIADIQRDQKVLINGASGSLGTAAVQLARHFGAEVTGVCSTSNLEMVSSLGADHVIDYTKTDFTQSGETHDIIFDTIGKSSFSRCKKVLKENGVYLSPVLSFPLLLQMVWSSWMSRKKAKFSATGLRPVPELRILLDKIIEIIEAGELKIVLDKKYRLEETPEAHRYIDKGHKKEMWLLFPESFNCNPRRSVYQ